MSNGTDRVLVVDQRTGRAAGREGSARGSISSSARLKASLLAATACAAALVAAEPAWAQGSQLTEVIVTARKRQESILNVPVIETAIPQQQLERLQVKNLNDIQAMVPGLLLGTAVAVSGMQVSIRGVGTSTTDPGVDQSISLNIDGQQFSQGLAYFVGMFDVGQVEVLKGPQALFYGKSSPGGVISLRTADPTNKFEVIARVGYEPEARERRGELIVSGPVSDTLRLRLGGLYSKQDGFYYNPAVAAPGLGGLTLSNNRVYGEEQYILRGTALWNPTAKFDARMKLNYARERLENGGIGQYTSCPDGVRAPFGIPFIGGGEDCKLDRTFRAIGGVPAAYGYLPFGGVPTLLVDQTFGTLEMNYRPSPELTVTSTTGFYLSRTISSFNGSNSVFAGSPFWLYNNFNRHEVTEEVRVNSDFQGPLNFTAGGFYQDGAFTHVISLPTNRQLPLPLPANLVHGRNEINLKSVSVFGQARWQIIPKVELSAGARWTDEKRSLRTFDMSGPRDAEVIPGTPKIESKTVSPELTLTYKPTDNITIFGALKRGYKSGSFNVGLIPVAGQSTNYGDEKVEGGEIGLKTRLLNRRLAFDLAVYDYKYSDLQVGTIEPSRGPGSAPQARTVNAGRSKVRGVDFSSSWRPEAVDGLTLNLNANWNKGDFQELNNVPCYPGQTIAAGCSSAFNPVTGLFTAQNLSGTSLPRAPRWQANGGFDYERPFVRGMTLVFTNNNSYTSKFVTFLGGTRADFFQGAYFKTDASVALRGADDRWELALIGKNLTNKLTTSNCVASNHENGAILGGDVTGGTGSGPAGVAEVQCRMERGREVWLRVTLRPFN